MEGRGQERPDLLDREASRRFQLRQGEAAVAASAAGCNAKTRRRFFDADAPRTKELKTHLGISDQEL